MIKYKLNCKNCNLLFDSWFSSSSEFEKLKRKDFLNCHNCNSNKIEKTLMAPKVIKNSTIERISQKESKVSEITKKVKEYQKFIKKNLRYVGKNFAYEARSIHYNNKKMEKGVFGTASVEEIKELKAEGIETEMIPWIEDKNN